MTIRQQIFLFTILLFLGVGAIGGAVAYWLEMEVVRQGFEEEARALSVAVTEFIEPADVAALKEGAPLAKTRLGTVLSRLGRWGIVKRLYLIDPASGRSLADTAPSGTPLPDLPAIKNLEGGEVRPLGMRAAEDGHSLLPLLEVTGDGAAVVGVEISADDYLGQRGAILRDVEFDAALAALVGLGVATVLGGLISRPILRLGVAVDRIGAPTFAAADTDSVIQEAADLGNTFGVMNSVLGETVEKARSALFESDAYGSESGLAAVFRREFQPPATWSGAGAEAAWLSAGSPPPAALAGAVALGSKAGAAFSGTAGPGDQLPCAVRARAAADFLADSLSRRPAAVAGAETLELFGLRQLVVARWQDDILEVWRGGTEEPPAAPDTASWPAGAPIALACLGPANRERLEVYLANFSAHPTKNLLVELPPLLDAAEPGAVLVLRRSATS